jgi:Nucleotidyl transferase AbiEii toxin, Type IV TA system
MTANPNGGVGSGSADPCEAAAWRAARRAALDHVLSLIAQSSWSDGLVLRGSMAMLAWAGDAAREPGDLDWVVLDRLAIPVDSQDPYPYVDELDFVQQWPEAADGAARYEIWRHEEFEAGGSHPVLPPEGLRWVIDADATEPSRPYADLIESVRSDPEAAAGLLLDADGAHEDGEWTYAGYDTPGVRLIIPWQADGLGAGHVQLDFARDERLPQAPILSAIPRGDGGPPTVVRTASRELSLAWKLLWLYTDSVAGTAACKDLYDAVVLAEADETRLSPDLLRKVLSRAPIEGEGFGTYAIHVDEADWAEFRRDRPGAQGTAGEWCTRLLRAVRAGSRISEVAQLRGEGAATPPPRSRVVD